MKILIVTAMFAVAAGCSSSDDTNKKPNGSSGYVDHSSPYPDCDAIIKACHPFDVGEGDIHDCHDQGHEATSNASCEGPIREHCLSICHAAADAADGGAKDAAADSSDSGGPP